MGNELLSVCGLGILIITATIGMLIYDAHHGSDTPEHRSRHCGGGRVQPCRSWRGFVCVWEALRFSSSSGMGYVRVCEALVCMLSVLYCYFTYREIVNREQSLSPPVS